MILHTINASPATPAFTDCLRVATANDAILLLGDAVYAALEGTEAWNTLRASGASIYSLFSDTVAAGITVAGNVENVDMDGFVALSEQYPRQQAWY